MQRSRKQDIKSKDRKCITLLLYLAMRLFDSIERFCNKVGTLILTSSSNIILLKGFADKVACIIFAVAFENNAVLCKISAIKTPRVKGRFFHKSLGCL